MKAIHNSVSVGNQNQPVVLYPKDTEKWKQFTTQLSADGKSLVLFCIPKILKNESNSQRFTPFGACSICCFVSQRYWKMKAIHNIIIKGVLKLTVVLYPKDTEKWKQFTTVHEMAHLWQCCFVSQRYWKMKAIHNQIQSRNVCFAVVLYPKDTEKWKQFTT